MATSQETEAIKRVLRLLQCTDPDSALAAAMEVAERFFPSPRAKYLPVHVQEMLVKTMSRGLDKSEILMQGVDTLKSLIKTCNESIVFALYHARLLILTGDYSGADVECRKALQIHSPQDPELHEIPFGSISGKDYCERVRSVKEEINNLLKLLSLQVQWGLMTAETRESFLSVKVDNLIKHFSGNQSDGPSISHVLYHFRTTHTWNLYICPLPGCDGYTSEATGLAIHISSLHFMKPPISVEQAMIEPGLCNVVFLQEGLLCFRSIEDMIHCVVSLSTGFVPPSFEDLRSKTWDKAAATVQRIRDEEHEDEEFKLLWIKLLEASVIDYRIYLLPSLASYMMEEMVKNGNISVEPFVDFEQCFAEGLELGYEKMEGVNETIAASSSLFSDFDFSQHDDGEISDSEQMSSANAGVLRPYIDLLSGDACKSCFSQDERKSISKAKTEDIFNLSHPIDVLLEAGDNKNKGNNVEQMLSVNAGVLPPYIDLLSGDAYKSCFSQDERKSISKAITEEACQDKQCIEEAISLMSESLDIFNLSHPIDGLLEAGDNKNKGDNLTSIQDLITFDEETPNVAPVAQLIDSLVDLEGKMKKNVKEQDIGHTFDEPIEFGGEDESQNADGKMVTRSENSLMDSKEKGKKHVVEKKRTEIIHHSEMYRRQKQKVDHTKQSLFNELATENMTPCDPYGNEALHQNYFMDLKKKEPDHVCSVCYFERDTTKAFKSVFHYQDIHSKWGKRCDFCSARFVSEYSLNKHLEFCHKPSVVSIKKEEKPG